jgi:hypothetical protein
VVVFVWDRARYGSHGLVATLLGSFNIQTNKPQDSTPAQMKTTAKISLVLILSFSSLSFQCFTLQQTVYFSNALPIEVH